MPAAEPAPTDGPAPDEGPTPDEEPAPEPEPEPEIETVGEAPSLVDAPQPEQDFAAPEVVESKGPVYLTTEQPKRVSDFEDSSRLGMVEESTVEEPVGKESDEKEEE